MLALVLGWWLEIPWWTELSWHPTTGFAFLAGVALSLGSWWLFQQAGRWRLLDMEWFMQELMRPLFSRLAPIEIALIAVSSGFAEEALFRGVGVEALGLFSSSLLFGLLHTGHRNLLFMGAWSTLVAGGLGYYYLQTGDLLGCMICHGVTNFTSLGRLAREFSDPSTVPQPSPKLDAGL